MTRALIFGANGQDGYYLSQFFKKEQVEVQGISRGGPWNRVDMQCFSSVRELVLKFRPTQIFHLAAVSSTEHDAVFVNDAAISRGTLNILEAVKQTGMQCQIFLPGSGVQFENNGKPISEFDDFSPSSPYSVSRIHSVYAARYYRGLGIPVYVGYLFHHDSPRRSQRHVSQKIAQAALRIGHGAKEKLRLGDLGVEKEWSFAGDIVQGIVTLLSQNQVFEAVIGSGKAYSIQQWVEGCFRAVGKDWREYVEEDNTYVAEYKRLVSNPATMRSLGWEPTVQFADLVDLMMSSPEKVFA
jgi:GDPmannose 4,6-dehydratase